MNCPIIIVMSDTEIFPYWMGIIPTGSEQLQLLVQPWNRER